MSTATDVSHPAPAPRTATDRLTGLLDDRAERSPWRLVAAVAAAGMAVSHIPVIQKHLTEAPYIGIGFILITIAGLVLMQLLLTRDTLTTWVAALVVSTLSLLGYLASRTVGLPQITDDIGNWAEPLGLVAIVAETILLITAITHLATRTSHPRC
ncbi:MAG: hypothetical protein M3Y49_05175 [Actinomycetota bacterium]|nr:hypothetical protein [Actinomycetota bacterium]